MRILLILLVIGLSSTLFCQEEGGEAAGAREEGKSKGKYALKINGGLSFGGELYHVDGIPNRRSPWSYTTSGRLGISVGKFRLPINFTYRDRQFAYDFTFNRFGASPSYKWATVHLGWRSMYFSPYTLAGRQFFGVGTELTPGKVYIGGLVGTIRNPLALRDSLTLGANLIPIFDRKLYGAKVGFRSGKHHFEVMAAKIYDDPDSFNRPENYDERGYRVLTAKENVVAGINAGFEIAKTVEFYVKTGVTVLTDDSQDPRTGAVQGALPDEYDDIITVNPSSNATFAGDAGLNIRIKSSRLGLQYRRVEPFYTTLATAYFQNDIEQYTGLVTTALFKRKLLLNGRVGLERNNLRNYRSGEYERLIVNTTAAYRPTDDWNINLRYANFTTDNNQDILEFNDTLRFVTVTNTAGFTAGRRFSGQSADFNVNLFTNFQRVDDQSISQRLDELDTYSASLSAGWTWKESDWSLGPSLQYHRFDLTERQQERFGVGLNLGKSLFNKKVNANFSSTLSQNDVNNLRDGTVGLHRLRLRYKLGKKTSLGLSSSYRHVQSIQRRNFQEWRSRLQANYRF